MAKRMRYPHTIETDQGNTVVKLIPNRMASTFHKCPECDKYTDLWEQHVLLLPTRFPGNRRYFHKDCYEAAKRSGYKIVMHPNLEYLTPYN